jgi:manganese-dependent inorganic pyrophosphatase
MRMLKRAMFVLSCLAILPSSAYAQAALAGVVKDASGAVLPGVTVEASSSSLIEKSRTAITDGTGQYRIPELTPGRYTVTFTLTGFATIRRENVDLTGSGVTTLSADMRIAEVRKKFGSNSPHAMMVTSEDGVLQGILTKTDLLKPVKTRLVLVDHNEMTQAIAGANEVTITEIIDHHRLGALNTPQPILFINEPVGSTCTIVADLFRREGLTPSPDIAGIMMGGIISDTLHLNSPTSTEKDATLLAWLAKIAGVNSRVLADEVFSSGSVILANPPDKVIRSDFKLYEEDNIRFAVSQVEELGFGNFWQHAKKLAAALQQLRDEERLAFAALLVTDINTQNSLLLVKGDAELIRRIHYAHVEKDEIFDLPGIVSRKKQLIPYLTSLLKEMQADGALPAAASRSSAPFAKAGT